MNAIFPPAIGPWVSRVLTLVAVMCLAMAWPAEGASRALGVDMAHWQGTADWVQARAQGRSFAMLAASDGKRDAAGAMFVDPLFASQAAAATQAGIRVGAYHFARPYLNSAKDEAAFFLSVARNYIGPGYLRPALDIEDPNDMLPAQPVSAMSNAALSAWIQEWCAEVERVTGVRPMLYMTTWFASNKMQPELAAYPLWIAYYENPPDVVPANLGPWGSDWLFLQYSVTGNQDWVENNPVDLDVFNGDEAALLTYIGAGGGDTAAPTVPTGLTASTVDSTRISLAWNAATDNVGVAYYRIWRDGAQVALVGPVTAYLDTGLAPATQHGYAVQACDASANCSAASAPAVATTAAAPAAAQVEVHRVAAGGFHTCAVTKAGAVQCWGSNDNGQLGDGTLVPRTSPAGSPAIASGAFAVAAGRLHSCAVVSGGGVQCWGANGSGQLGDGSVVRRTAPVAVSGISSGATSIAAGSLHTCAIVAGGTVKCWGRNSSGQLGDGTTTRRTAPVTVTGLTGVTAIAAGFAHTCAVTQAGGAFCWGSNIEGQLGDGTWTQRNTPAAVNGLGGSAVAIAAGYGHTCALLSTGAVKCWGDNPYGQLGDGTSTGRVLPTAVASLASGVAGISAGYYHSCAVLADGAARCWGENIFGQVGNGTTTDSLSPASPAGLGAAISITAGERHTCALWLGGLKCWGSNSYGQLGDGTTTVRLVPVDVASVAYAPCSDVTGNCASGSSRLVNISARSPVLVNTEVMIGGFVIGGSVAKKVLITARGPSLAAYGIAGVLANPRIDLYSGQTKIASNDDWQVGNPGAAEIAALGTFPNGLAPSSALESAILATLNPGAYTAVVSGVSGTTGVGIVEVFELDHPEAPLANLSTRGAVMGGSNVMIGGFVVSGSVPRTVLVTARGPSLAAYGITNPLGNPRVEIYSGQTRIAVNDDYGSAPNLAQILATGVAPSHPLEAAVLMTLPPGPYTAVVSGASSTAGVAIVEVFAR